MAETIKVLILGSGPAGYTAAIYAARANLNPVLIAGPQPGGQLTITTDVENFPGFPKPVNGPQLMQDMRAQAEHHGTKIINGSVTSVDFSKQPLLLKVDETEYLAQTVIIATGASAIWLGLESETKLRGKGVSGCATCDGFFFKGQDVVVIGGGDTAIEDALFLTNFVNKVTVVHRRDELRASKILQERAFANKKIEFAWKKVLQEIMDVKAGKVTGVKLKDVETNEMSELACEGVFIAVGHKPNTEIFKGQVELNENGYIITPKTSMKTNVAGVFAAGDVQDVTYRQAVLAAGTGCMAAIDAERYLSTMDHGQ
ncbi:MAG: thioredoxin-disulfide reductase [Pseudomonadota bacterium]